jgi:hypothetical protein
MPDAPGREREKKTQTACLHLVETGRALGRHHELAVKAVLRSDGNLF